MTARHPQRKADFANDPKRSAAMWRKINVNRPQGDSKLQRLPRRSHMQVTYANGVTTGCIGIGLS